MKNINKIMIVCMMMTIGSLSAVEFTVNTSIPGYITGMKGNYNPDTHNATINDASDNIVFTYDPVTTITSMFITSAPAGYTLIGTFIEQPPAAKPCKTITCAIATKSPTPYNVYGKLITNS